MLKPEIKDVQFCTQGRHMVPRAEITRMPTDNGKSWRSVCLACKAETLVQRAKAKK